MAAELKGLTLLALLSRYETLGTRVKTEVCVQRRNEC